GERTGRWEQRAETEQHQGGCKVERPTGSGPRGERRERSEAPHVDYPVHAGHGLEPERRHGIENRQHETDRVIDPEGGGEGDAEQLTAGEQRRAEREQVAGRWRRSPQVADVPFVFVEPGV